MAGRSIISLSNKYLGGLMLRAVIVDLGGSPHYMVKEIHEEPSILKTLWDSQRDHILKISSKISRSNRIYLVGSGSSYNACLVFHNALAIHGNTPSLPIVSGEYRLYRSIVSRGDTVIAVSQSGYTGDTVAAAKMARESGALVVGVTNNPESPLARISDEVINIMAGREEAVTATKTFTAQLYALLLLAAGVSSDSGQELLRDLEKIPKILLASISSLEPIARRIASDIYRYQNAFTLGEGVGYAVAREAALKLKEASGIHAESIQTSEARHGPKAILNKGFTVYINIFSEDDGKPASQLVKEVGDSGAHIYIVSPIEPGEGILSVSKETIKIPSLETAAISIIATSFYQLLSYYIAVARLLDPDTPRMLTKVVV